MTFDGSNYNGSVVSFSSGSVFISTAGSLTVSTTAPSMQVFSNQAFIATGSQIGSDQISVLTDTSGTATVGPAIASGTICGYLSTGKVMVRSSTTAGASDYYLIGISSGNPVLEKTFPSVSGTTSATGVVNTYTYPLGGPPNSANDNNGRLILRTSSGKSVSVGTSSLPFSVSLDGVTVGKYQQAAAYTNYGITDALSSDDTAWVLYALQSATTTNFVVRRVKLS
jgi:hypothetical protein